MSYDYMQQTPVHFGAGAINDLADIVKEMGCKKAFLVYDAGVKAAGIADKAIDSLEKAGIEYVVFDGVVADPPAEMLDEAGETAKAAGIDCVIGIGGGSSLDSAKAISILQKHPSPITDYLNLDGPPFTVDGGVPVILLPTTAGTGSEVTRMCIVTYTAINAKIPIYTKAAMAIVDPELCRTAPPSVTAYGGLDALAHALESVTCVHTNPFCELIALAAIKKIGKYLPRAVKNGNDSEAREQMSLAANWAGIAFSATDIHVGHAGGDSIAASYHTPHGLNVAWMSPAVVEAVANAVPDKVALVGEALGVKFDGNETPAEIGKKTGECIRALNKVCGIPSLESKGFDRDVIVNDGAKYIASSALLYNCPIPVDEEKAAEILSSVYDDYK